MQLKLQIYTDLFGLAYPFGQNFKVTLVCLVLPQNFVKDMTDFWHLFSLQESGQLLEVLTNMNPPFEIDGKVAIISYAKHDNPSSGRPRLVSMS